MNRVRFKRKFVSAKRKKGKGRRKPSFVRANSEMTGSSPPPKTFPEVPFLICRRRKSQPKISPLICQKRCQRIKTCQEYFDYLQPAMFDRYEKREAKERKKIRDHAQESLE